MAADILLYKSVHLFVLFLNINPSYKKNCLRSKQSWKEETICRKQFAMFSDIFDFDVETHENFRIFFFFVRQTYILIELTFAERTFASFVNFTLFHETLSREESKINHSRNLFIKTFFSCLFFSTLKSVISFLTSEQK